MYVLNIILGEGIEDNIINIILILILTKLISCLAKQKFYKKGNITTMTSSFLTERIISHFYVKPTGSNNTLRGIGKTNKYYFDGQTNNNFIKSL